MLVKFLGAIERVTGSCSWLKKGEVQFLVDCGMIQGEAHDQFENNKEFPFVASELKFIFLTHSHLDHCGLIPRLYKEGFIGRVYCTAATAKLSREIMLDAAKIDAPYEKRDVEQVKFSIIEEREDFKWGRLIPIDNDLFFNVFRSAHILGAVSIGISWGKEHGKSILFTGDIGNNTKSNPYQPLLKSRQSPDRKFKYIVCESTYGSRERDPSESSFENRINYLEQEVINAIHKKKGNLLIPTFSMHRTQELIFDLYYILKVKWKGRLRTGKYNTSLRNYINTYGLLGDWPISNEKYNLFLNDELVPNDIKKVIEASYFPFYRLSKKTYKHLVENLSININPSLVNENTSKQMEISAYLIDDVSLVNSINECLTILGLENTIGYKYEESEIDSSIYSSLEEMVEVEEVPVRVICDSPLGQRVSTIYGNELSKSYGSGGVSKRLSLNDQMSSWLSAEGDEIDDIIKSLYLKNKDIDVGVHSIQPYIKSNKAITDVPTVIISSSGMCDEGPILRHLSRLLRNEKNSVLLTGYQSPGSNGSVLYNLNEYSEEEKEENTIKLKNGEIKCSNIRASVSSMSGYSGHADQKSLLNYLFTESGTKGFTTPNMIINHGHNDTREAFKDAIVNRSKELLDKHGDVDSYKTNVIIPKRSDDWFNLEENSWVINEPETMILSNDTNGVSGALMSLTKAIEELTKEISKINTK